MMWVEEVEAPPVRTEQYLIAIHGTPAIPLADVCEQLFGIAYREARRKAALNLLPVPTYKALDSERAPLLVSAAALAKYLDGQAAEAERVWEHSQA